MGHCRYEICTAANRFTHEYIGIVDEDFFHLLHEFIELAAKTALHHFFDRYIQFLQHLTNNKGIGQIAALIIGYDSQPHALCHDPFCQGAKSGCLAGTQKAACKNQFYRLLNSQLSRRIHGEISYNIVFEVKFLARPEG